MNKDLERYIEAHRLVPELLFEEPFEFLELLFAAGGRVRSILWFEHTLVSKQKDSLGGGGYRDPQKTQYMYAETYLDKTDMEKASLEEVKAYIDSLRAQYPNNRLLPSFEIVLDA